MPKLSSLHKLLDPETRAKNLRALKCELRGLWYDLTRPAMHVPVFIVGCSRSGTTVTYETLSAAPQFLKFGWEIPQFWDGLYGPLNNGWQSEAAGAEQARPEHRHASATSTSASGRAVLDKTCINVMRILYPHICIQRVLYTSRRFYLVRTAAALGEIASHRRHGQPRTRPQET